jgi:hypothetical protein
MFNRNRNKIGIADLYPNLSPAEQIEARENLLRYLAVVKKIYEELPTENPKLLTELRRRARLRKERQAFK